MSIDDLLSRDRDLLERFRAGERRALEAVFMAYEGLVRTIAVRGFGGFCGFRNTADTDDAIAATFEAAFQERARLAYDGVQPYRYYLGGTARNIIRTMCRKQGREIPMDEPPQTGEPGEELLGRPEASVEGRESRELLERFRSALDDPQRVAVFEGYFGEGLSEAALARALNMKRYRVRVHLVWIRRCMSRFLREEGLV